MKRYMLWTSLSLIILVLGVGGYYAFAVFHFAQDIQNSHKESIFHQVNLTKNNANGSEVIGAPEWESTKPINVLLLGGDSRSVTKSDVPRSDSMLVASIHPITKKACLFSILRDTYVAIPGHGEDRINMALTLGGPELAMKTVSDLFGIPISYYVYTDFQGFIALIDALGGIEIEVEKNMLYADTADDHLFDIQLKKGMQHLDGKMALQYVRFRHDAMSDFARSERQRKFLTALASKLQLGWSFILLPKMLHAVYPFVETNISVSEMVKLAPLAMEVKVNEIVKVQLPPMNLVENKHVHGASVIGVNVRKLKLYVQQLLAGTAPS